jgi:hypothetical protein
MFGPSISVSMSLRPVIKLTFAHPVVCDLFSFERGRYAGLRSWTSQHGLSIVDDIAAPSDAVAIGFSPVMVREVVFACVDVELS